MLFNKERFYSIIVYYLLLYIIYYMYKISVLIEIIFNIQIIHKQFVEQKYHAIEFNLLINLL